VGPPRDPSARGRSHGAEGTKRRKKLQDEPVAEDQHGGNWHEENEDEGQDAGARVENCVGAHDPGDGAAGPQGRNTRMHVEQHVQEARADSAKQIEKQIGDVAVEVFDVVAKNPEEKHVAGDVQQAGVQEHAGE